MAWTYSDWPSQSGTAAKLARLNLHITEVSNSVGKEVSADGKAVSSQATQAYLTTLFAQQNRLESKPGLGIGGGVSVAGFGGTIQ